MTVQVARSLYEGTILRVMRVTMPSMPRLGKTQSSNSSSYQGRMVGVGGGGRMTKGGNLAVANLADFLDRAIGEDHAAATDHRCGGLVVG